MGRRMTLAPDNIASSIGWELFSHDADVGVRGFGATVAEAFEGAALALTAVITDARIIELLLVEWLNAVIYEMAVRHMIFGRFAVEIEDRRLRGTLWGEPADLKRHAPVCEPKGATYTALRVALDESESCVVDV